MVRSDGRNDAALAAALEAMAQAMQNQPNAENAGSRSLATFQRENPPVFKGKYDPDGALGWLKEIERIFRVMDLDYARLLLHPKICPILVILLTGLCFAFHHALCCIISFA